MLQNSILFYDLETTALEISKACILECYITNWTGTQSRHWYIYPSDQQPITNSHIHNITEEVLREKNAVTTDVFLTEFCDFVENFRGNIDTEGRDETPIAYLVAHNNNRYDRLVLREEFKRMGREGEISRYWSNRDSLVHFRRIYPNLGYGKYSLGELYNANRDVVKIPENSLLHSAKTDTEILRQLYVSKIAGHFNIQNEFRYFFYRMV